MGRIGTSELILIFAIALIFFGPSKLPELGKMIGRSIGTAKRYMNEVEEELNLEGKTKKEGKDMKEEKEKEELVVDARTASKENN